jgi:hypothetical protein
MVFAPRQPLVLATLNVNSVITELQPLLVQSLGSKGTLALRLAPAVWRVEVDMLTPDFCASLTLSSDPRNCSRRKHWARL